MKVLTAAQMREVDRLTIERGISGLILMENAAAGVVEVLTSRFAPLSSHRIAVFCGKGNNGGDALAVARQLYTRCHPRGLHVVLAADPGELRGDAAENLRMLTACGCPFSHEVTLETRLATLVIDGLLGTGVKGPATGAMLDSIRQINTAFPVAKIVAIDMPSGMPSDSGEPVGEFVRADYTVTFTAVKMSQALPPNCDHVGELHVVPIGSPPELYENIPLSLVEPLQFRSLLAPRPRSGHKGDFGHVLVIGGAHGKIGAAAMAGLAALRAGAGLVTVACSVLNLTAIAPELMTAALPDSQSIAALAQTKDVIAIGPGLGADPPLVSLTRSLFAESDKPMLVDADALNALAGQVPDLSRTSGLRVLTPHPGEMARLVGRPVTDRVAEARTFPTQKRVPLLLNGERTIIELPYGRVQ